MSGNAQKTPFGRSLNLLAKKQADDANFIQGQSLPCTVTAVQGSTVTVSFDVNSKFTLPNVTMPVNNSRYARDPIQIGDKGFAVPGNAYLGGVSGLGGGTADLSVRGNLSTLSFQLISNTSFPSPSNPNSYNISGPTGAVIQDDGKTTSISVATGENVTVTPASGKTLTVVNMPTSPAGLPTGSLWNNGGVVNVV